MRPELLKLGLALLVLDGCTDAGGGAFATPPPTVIFVDPEVFLGDLVCADTPGAMRRYVVTLVDVTRSPGEPADLEVALPSSDPVRCQAGVAFDRVVPKNLYVADIQGYDRTDLRPTAPGSPILLAPDGSYAAPRWVTSCGRSTPHFPGDPDGSAGPAPVGDADAGDGAETEGGAAPSRYVNPVRALQNLTVRIHDCAPLVDLRPPTNGVTAIRIDPARAFSDGACAADAGVAGNYEVTVRQTGAVESASCAEPVVFTELEAGREYVFDVRGFDATATTAIWGTTCYRVARAGVTLDAGCDPPVPLN